MAALAFCCLCSEKGKWKRSESGAVILMKLQRAAFSAIIWFGDLNAVALRQLLI